MSGEKAPLTRKYLRQRRFFPRNAPELIQARIPFWEKSIFYSSSGLQTGDNYVFDLPMVSLTEDFLDELLGRLPADSDDINDETIATSDHLIDRLYPEEDMHDFFFERHGSYSQHCFFGFNDKEKRYFFTVRFTAQQGGYRQGVTLNLHINQNPDDYNGFNTMDDLINHLNDYYNDFIVPDDLKEIDENNIPDSYEMKEIFGEAEFTMRAGGEKSDKDEKDDPSAGAGSVSVEMVETSGESPDEIKGNNLHSVESDDPKATTMHLQPSQWGLQKTVSSSPAYAEKLYIYILEGKIGRLEHGKTPTNIYGLCTDEFTSCNILVLISANRARYVLIHVDIKMDLQPIREQIAWVGNNANLFLIRRKDSGFGSQPSDMVKNRLLREFGNIFSEIIAYSDVVEVVSIEMGETKPRLRETLPENSVFHKDLALLFLQHKLEVEFTLSIFLKDYLKPFLFDIFTWNSCTNFDLSPPVTQKMKIFGVNEKPIDLIFNAIYRSKPGSERSFIIHHVIHCVMYCYLNRANEVSFEGFLEYCLSFYPKVDTRQIVEIILRNVNTFEGDIFKPQDFLDFANPTGEEIAEKCPNLPQISYMVILNAYRTYEKLLPSNSRHKNISIPYRGVKEENKSLSSDSSKSDFRASVRREDNRRTDECLLTRTHSDLAGLSGSSSMTTPLGRSLLPANATSHSVRETKSDAPVPENQVRQKTVNETKKASPTDFFKSLRDHARQDLVDKNYKGAIEKYNQLIGIYEQQPTANNRNKAIAHYGVGFSYLNLGNLAKAHESLTEAVKLDPSTSLYRDKLQACAAAMQKRPLELQG